MKPEQERSQTLYTPTVSIMVSKLVKRSLSKLIICEFIFFQLFLLSLTDISNFESFWKKIIINVKGEKNVKDTKQFFGQVSFKIFLYTF